MAATYFIDFPAQLIVDLREHDLEVGTQQSILTTWMAVPVEKMGEGNLQPYPQQKNAPFPQILAEFEANLSHQITSDYWVPPLLIFSPSTVPAVVMY